jgi:type III pantothenate kinase
MPDSVIGRDTASQLRAGIVTGHLAMLEGMIERTRAELGERATVILTGGLAPLFAGRSPLFEHYAPDLTLSGLHLIYERIASDVRQPEGGKRR